MRSPLFTSLQPARMAAAADSNSGGRCSRFKRKKRRQRCRRRRNSNTNSNTN